jgi:hypothetical protein
MTALWGNEADAGSGMNVLVAIEEARGRFVTFAMVLYSELRRIFAFDASELAVTRQ